MLIEFKVLDKSQPNKDGLAVLMESKTQTSSNQLSYYSTGSETVAKATAEFNSCLSVLAPTAIAIRDSFEAAAPDEAEVEFSFKLSAEGKLIVVNALAEACFKVTLKWNNKDTTTEM